MENWFVDRMLEHLGFDEETLLVKTSISEVKVGKGSKSCLYKPDYIIKVKGFPCVVVDAKAPNENLDDWVNQCCSYCLELNRQYEHNPVEYFILSSGVETRLYRWDQADALFVIPFDAFEAGNPTFRRFADTISPSKLAQLSRKKTSELQESEFRFEGVSLEKISAIFADLHQFIWEKEKKTPSGAFLELIKVIFVKIKKDRDLRASLGPNGTPKVKDVVFSAAWIQSQTENANPVNDPLFKNLLRDLEVEIEQKAKRRIFDKHDEINLSPATLLKIVRDIEHIDFDSMDEDIHGRMFESFLDATTRGPALGQFFTPRDIVQLTVQLADIQVSKHGAESVLDACCGSGGFLIGALADMNAKARQLAGLTAKERKHLLDKVANTSLTGIDAGSEPPIYRIARMNMYLHGDGGSNIYFGDSLDKQIGVVGKSDIEVGDDIRRLRKMILEDGKRFQVILSNPPFSMKYGRDTAEQRDILNQYDIGGQARDATTMLSSVMFLERYLELVEPGGRILRIIDDSILSGESYARIRDFIRAKFIIRAVISLPGDAFKRADARVKTSLIILQPRAPDDEQGDVFMEKAVYLGLVPKTAKRIGINAAELSTERHKEIDRIVANYRAFTKGVPGQYVVAAAQISDRLDVKHCLQETGRRVKLWRQKGEHVQPLTDLLSPASGRACRVQSGETYKLLKVTYAGEVTEAEEKDGDDCSYSTLFKVKGWDILFSNMGIGRGAIGIVPTYLEGSVVSNEYTILRAKSEVEAFFYCNIIRTQEILGDILSSTTGMNRGRIRWEDMRNIHVPTCAKNAQHITTAVSALKALWRAHCDVQNNARELFNRMAARLKLDGPDARLRWLAYKPPE